VRLPTPANHFGGDRQGLSEPRTRPGFEDGLALRTPEERKDASLTTGPNDQDVLVTGATGFVGSHLVRALLARGCRVTALARPSADFWRIADVSGQIEILPVDLITLDVDSIYSRVKRTELIFHLASAGVDQSFTDTLATWQANTTGFLRLLGLANRIGVTRLVYCGSCFEYGEGLLLREDSPLKPISEYGASKAAAHLLAETFYRRYRLPIVHVRPFTVYGPYEPAHRLVPSTIIKAFNGGNIELTKGEQTRDFIFVDDVVQMLLAAATSDGVIGETLNACTGIATTVRDAVAAILGVIQGTATPIFGARPYRDAEIWQSSGDPTKASALLHLTAPTPFLAGIEQTVEWFSSQRLASRREP
jgi:nucleoside-diphosphate-sugar epimerase